MTITFKTISAAVIAVVAVFVVALVALGFPGTTYNLYLDHELKDAESMRPLVQVVEAASRFDTVVLHIASFGGDGEGMEYLENAILASKAHTVAIVEASAYSAGAYLATSTQTLIMRPATFLMFHSGSQVGNDCGDAIGQKDRGHDAFPKCEQVIAALDANDILIIDRIKILTPQEKKDIIAGYDVYLTADEVNKRLVNMADATVVKINYDTPALIITPPTAAQIKAVVDKLTKSKHK